MTAYSPNMASEAPTMPVAPNAIAIASPSAIPAEMQDRPTSRCRLHDVPRQTRQSKNAVTSPRAGWWPPPRLDAKIAKPQLATSRTHATRRLSLDRYLGPWLTGIALMTGSVKVWRSVRRDAEQAVRRVRGLATPSAAMRTVGPCDGKQRCDDEHVASAA
jgi:hypothetical protein